MFTFLHILSIVKIGWQVSIEFLMVEETNSMVCYQGHSSGSQFNSAEGQGVAVRFPAGPGQRPAEG